METLKLTDMKKNSSLVLFVLIAFCSCSKFEKEKIPFKSLDGTVAKSYIAKYAKLSKSFPPDPVSYKPDSLSLKYLELGQELIQEISKKSNVLRVRFYTALDSSDKFLVLMQVAITDKTFFLLRSCQAFITKC